ncbi:CpaF family protein, partial [Ochrobactrum sp. SFR4]|nr:CpaF family protein [Ochrobactrum sp. SFR4]
MFGKRGASTPATTIKPIASQTAGSSQSTVSTPLSQSPSASTSGETTTKPVAAPVAREKSQAYYDTKSQIFAALIDTI